MTNLSTLSKEEKLLVIQLLMILLKGEQIMRKQNKIWDSLPVIGLSLDDMENHLATINQPIFEAKMRAFNQEKINMIIEEIHSLLWAEPKAKAMEYFHVIQIFEKITLTSKKHFFEITDKYNTIEVYPEFKALKLIK